jgi:hypothetical protein
VVALRRPNHGARPALARRCARDRRIARRGALAAARPVAGTCGSVARRQSLAVAPLASRLRTAHLAPRGEPALHDLRRRRALTPGAVGDFWKGLSPAVGRRGARVDSRKTSGQVCSGNGAARERVVESWTLLLFDTGRDETMTRSATSWAKTVAGIRLAPREPREIFTLTDSRLLFRVLPIIRPPSLLDHAIAAN